MSEDLLGASLDLDFGGGAKAEAASSVFEDGSYNAFIEKVEVKNTKPKDGVEQKASDGSPARYLNIQWRLRGNEKNDKRVLFQIVSMRFPQNALDDEEKERTTRNSFLHWINTVTGTDLAGSKQSLSINNLLGSEATLVVATRYNDFKGEKENYIVKVSPKGEAGGGDSLDSIRRTL